MTYLIILLIVVISVTFPSHNITSPDMPLAQVDNLLKEAMTESEYVYGSMRGKFGSNPWMGMMEEGQTNVTLPRTGRKLGAIKGARLWPDARIPYEFSDTIDFSEWTTMQLIFSNISSLANIRFEP